MKANLKTNEKPPVAARVESTASAHDEQWVDHYAWLRAENWQEVIKDPSKLAAPIANYLQAENDYCDKATAPLATLQEEITAELRERQPAQDESLPRLEGPYYYQHRIDANSEYPIHVRTDLNGEHEQIVFDENLAAMGHEYCDIGQTTVSPDHSKLLWSRDTNGSEYYTIYIRDIKSGKDRDYVIKNARDAAWGDDQTVFYTRQDDYGNHHQVYKHKLGNDPENDILIFSETDERFGCDVYRSYSREVVFIQTSSTDQDEFWFIPVDDVDSDPVLIQARKKGLEYDVMHQGDRFIIETNADSAVDWKLVETPLSNPSIENWIDLVPHQAGRMIDGYITLENWIIWFEMVDALPQIAYMDKHGNIERVAFKEEAYSLSLSGHFGYHTDFLMFQYSSPTTPWETYEFNLQTAERNLLKRQVIPSGHNPEDYMTKRFTAESHDGAQVPVTLVYRKDTPLDGSAPAMLYGYGSYGSSISAGFGPARFSLIDRGFIYAIAHVRGGSERGGAWHEDSKLENKANSFHDFIAVGDAMVAQGYCAAGKIVSLGESAGGLLVAASMQMKPELFAGVIAAEPDVDVLNLMLDSTLPGIPTHFALWGNPAESKAAFDTIRSYSPYENTKATAYPSLYVTAGISDQRVFYWQAAKWVAKMRALKTDDNVILFRTDMNSGHFGKTGRSEGNLEVARRYAFAIAVTGD